MSHHLMKIALGIALSSIALCSAAPTLALDHTALAERFGGEDENCRLMTLKAMDYIGHPAGTEFIRQQGSRDSNLPVRVLAARSLAA